MSDAPKLQPKKPLYALMIVPIIGTFLSGLTGFVIGLVIAAVLFLVLQKAGNSDPPKQDLEHPCPYCRKLIPQAVETCPHCGQALP